MKEMDGNVLMSCSKAIPHLLWSATPRVLALGMILTKDVTWQLKSVLPIFAYIQRLGHPFKWCPPSPEANAVLNCIEMQRRLNIMISCIPFTCWLLMSASWVVSLWFFFLSWRLLSGLEHHIQEASQSSAWAASLKFRPAHHLTHTL